MAETQVVELNNNGQKYNFEVIEVKGRKPKLLQEKLGKEANTILAPAIPTAQTLPALIAFIGPDLFFKKVWTEVLRPAGSDAYIEALGDDGKLNGQKYSTEFADCFKARERRKGGPKKSDLEKQVAEISPEFLACFKALQTNKNPDGTPLLPAKKQEIQARSMRLFDKIEELNAQIAHKERKSRKKEEEAGITA